MDDLSIGEVAERVGVATSAIRFWEAEGLVESRRTDGGQRRFSRDVVRRISFIKAAQEVGVGLAEIADVLDALPADRAPTARDWARSAKRWRARLDERIVAMERLRDQLDSCIGCGCLSLSSCGLYNPADEVAVRGPGPRFLIDGPPPR